MNRRKSISLRALLLLLMAAGPLQAQSVFACAMMDRVVHDPCCCEQHDAVDEDNVQPDRKVAPESGDPCCERSVQVAVDPDAGRAAPVSPEPRSDPDPSQPLVFSIDPLLPPQPAVKPGDRHLHPAAGHPGSGTWLVTRRLRI